VRACVRTHACTHARTHVHTHARTRSLLCPSVRTRQDSAGLDGARGSARRERSRSVDAGAAVHHHPHTVRCGVRRQDAQGRVPMCARGAGRHCGCTLPVVRRMVCAHCRKLSVVVRTVQYSEYPTAPQHPTVAIALRPGHRGARVGAAWDWRRRVDCEGARCGNACCTPGRCVGTLDAEACTPRHTPGVRCAPRRSSRRARARALCAARTRSGGNGLGGSHSGPAERRRVGRGMA
jgi:hypothetical protein